MKQADLFRKLAALKLDPEQMAGVLEIMDEEAEGRKEKARARWHKWKDSKPANVSKRLPTAANVSSPLTRADPSLSTLEITGKEERKKEEARDAPSPRAKRLPADWTISEAWLVEAIEAGLSRSQAQAEARKMHNWSLSDRNGAKLNWLATWRNWFARAVPQQRGGAPPKPMTVGDIFREDARNLGLMHDDEPSSTFDRRMDSGHGSGQGVSTGIARRITISGDLLGKI